MEENDFLREYRICMNKENFFAFPKIIALMQSLAWINEYYHNLGSIQIFKNIPIDLMSPSYSLCSDLSKIMDAMAGTANAVQGTVKNPVAKQALRELGILPHNSTPWNLFNPDTPDEFAEAVLSHYSAAWDEARTVFLTNLDAYQIGEDVKELFTEGIECHTAKLYRATVLTVLPAAETEFRRTFKIAPSKAATSLEELRKAIMEAPAKLMLCHVAPLDLFEILDEHVYKKVGTQEDVERLAANPIPNRHAAVHGLIQYKSELCSLNALILADYVFFLISQMADNLELGERINKK